MVVRKISGYRERSAQGCGKAGLYPGGLWGMGLAVKAGHLSPLRALSPGMFWARSRWSRM